MTPAARPDEARCAVSQPDRSVDLGADASSLPGGASQRHVGWNVKVDGLAEFRLVDPRGLTHQEAHSAIRNRYPERRIEHIQPAVPSS